MDGLEIRHLLALNIKRLRENRKISQADLAFDSGISIPFLSDIERGNKWPSPETLGKIITVLKVEVFELFAPEAILNNEDSVFVEKIVREIAQAQKNLSDEIIDKYFRNLN